MWPCLKNRFQLVYNTSCLLSGSYLPDGECNTKDSYFQPQVAVTEGDDHSHSGQDSNKQIMHVETVKQLLLMHVETVFTHACQNHQANSFHHLYSCMLRSLSKLRLTRLSSSRTYFLIVSFQKRTHFRTKSRRVDECRGC